MIILAARRSAGVLSGDFFSTVSDTNRLCALIAEFSTMIALWHWCDNEKFLFVLCTRYILGEW